MKQVTLVDREGKDVSVPQEQLVPLLRAGFKARTGQTVTLGDEQATEIPVERVVEGLNRGLVAPRLQTEREAFEREAQQRFGGGTGLAAGLAYGGLQGATLGLGGRALMETGLVSPQTLAQLEEARGGGLFSTIGAGELIGGTLALKGAGRLLGPAAGSAAEAALLEKEAAKSVGRRIAETTAREAGIGSAYATGSELTQAGIEGREANLGEAARAGAQVGALFGAAGSTLAEGASKAKARFASATERRAAEDIANIPTATPEGVDKAAASAKLSAQQEKVREYAKTASENLANIVERINTAQKGADDLGYGLSGKGLKKITGQIERLRSSIDSLDTKLVSAEAGEVERLAKTLDDVFNTSFKNKSERAMTLKGLDADLRAANEDLALAQQSKSSKLSLDSIQSRIEKLTSAREAFQSQEEAYTLLGQETVKLSAIADNLGKEYRGKARATSRADAIRRKLSDLGEKGAELAGSTAQQARDEASEFIREANLLGEQAGVAASDAARSGIKAGSRYGEQFAQPTLEASKGPFDSFRSLVGDMFTVERGMYKEGERLVEGGPKTGAKKASVFTQLFDQPTIRQSLSPENAAYVRAIASGAKEVDLVRGAHHKSTRAKNIVNAIDQQFAAEGGLENVLGPQRYSEIVESAMSDGRAILANEPTEQMAKDVLARYKEAALPAGTEAAVEAAPTLADSKTITATAPQDTDSLRKKLAEYEQRIAEHDKVIDTLADERAAAFTERRKLTDKIANAKTAERRRVLDASITDAMDRENLLRSSQEAVESARAKQMESMNSLRDQRRSNAVDAATDAADANAARQALNSAKQAVDRKVLTDRRTSLGKKLNETELAKQALEAHLNDFRSARGELEALIGKGEGGYVRSAMGGRLVPAAEEQIFERKMADFMRSPEGRDIASALKAAAPAASGSMTTKEVVGILGLEALASSLLGPALGTVVTGITTAAMSGKKGVWTAAKTLMNPIKFWSATENTLKALSQLTTESGRRSEMRKTYQFPVAEANSYLDSIVEDRAAADEAFNKLAKSGVVNARNIDEARRRFSTTLDYLERKRPPTSNGADAQAFARSVAILRNPDLLTKFVRDGSLRQQDVDLLQKVSPESYEQLKNAVASIHQEKPQAVAALAPLFKLMIKDKYMVRTNLPMYVLQQMGGASLGQGQPGQGVPMQAKSEAAAARGRASSASNSPLVSSAGFEDQGPLGK